MLVIREFASSKLACIVTYGAMKREVNGVEVYGVNFMNDIPYVGDYAHWNVKRVEPVALVNGQYLDVRTGEAVPVQKNSQVWPLFTGTVLNYPDGKEILLSCRYRDGVVMALDVTGEAKPETVTFLTVRN